jgi:hypothetical protein
VDAAFRSQVVREALRLDSVMPRMRLVLLRATAHATGMEADRILHGTVCQWDTPDWTALANLLGTDLLPRFKWMYEIELEDGARVQAYMDSGTRRYLHLADDGRAFHYTPRGRYREVPWGTAVVGVFEDSNGCSLTPAEEAALRVALSKARPHRPSL